MKNIITKTFLSLALTFLMYIPAASASYNGENAHLVLLNGKNIEQAQVIIENYEADVDHIFPDAALIATLNEGAQNTLLEKGFILKNSQLSESELNNLNTNERIAALVWNNGFEQRNESTGEDFPEIAEDSLHEKRSHAVPYGAGGAAYNAGFYETSEFLHGSVLVNIILPESNGAIDANTHNWTEAQEAEILSEIQSGMSWWQTVEPNANLTFTYNMISGRTNANAQTSYEPIGRPGWKQAGGQDVWIQEIMGNLGYTSSSYFTNSRSFLNDQRDIHGTDWAVTMFVVNDGNVSQTFTDGSFAYSYFGGPFMVMTYANAGYGINNFDAVAAHEFAHAFYALDQYASALQDCDQTAGYLRISNENSLYSSSGGSCDSNVSSLMRGGVTPFTNEDLDEYARGQMGIVDSDGDGILDVVDTRPDVVINSRSEGPTVTITGTATVQPYANNNHYQNTFHSGEPVKNITTNKIADVEYRVDGGAWQDATASDGSFNSGSEGFTFSFSGSSSSTVEIRAQNSVGNWSDGSESSSSVAGKLIVAGAGESGGPHIRFFDNQGALKSGGFFAFPSSWRTGVRVATGDVDGDGGDEIIAAPGPGGDPTVRVFESNGTLISSFNAYPNQFKGGLYVAAGDLDNDGTDEIVTGTGDGGGPQVRTFDKDGNVLFTPGFFAYGENFRGGVQVATGDFNGDGKEEIITGAGVGGGPQVMGYTRYGVRILNFFAYAENLRTGVAVSAGDIDGDGGVEIVTGAGNGGGPHVRVFNGVGQPKIEESGFFAYQKHVRSGVKVATFDLNGDGKNEIIAGTGVGGGPHIRQFYEDGRVLHNGFFAFAEHLRSGVNIAAGEFR